MKHVTKVKTFGSYAWVNSIKGTTETPPRTEEYGAAEL
jgi:hypothetical protein